MLLHLIVSVAGQDGFMLLILACNVDTDLGIWVTQDKKRAPFMSTPVSKFSDEVVWSIRPGRGLVSSFSLGPARNTFETVKASMLYWKQSVLV